MNRSSLLSYYPTKILTGGRRTSASNVRDVYQQIIESTVNLESDLNVANGYLGISASGIVDNSFIKSLTPTGAFLRDDGTWQTVSGSSLTLADVLGNDNKTGGLSIVSDNGYSGLSILNSVGSLYFYDGINSGSISADSTGTHLLHTLAIDFSAPDVIFSLLTADRVPYLDLNNALKSSIVTQAELEQLTGVTSNIQSQISAMASGVSAYKDPCLVATTGNISLSGEQTLDGVLTSGSRVLVWKQTNPVLNGIYVSAAGAWVRSTDFDNNSDKIASSSVFVQQGTIYGDREFICTSNAPVVVGTDNINFIEYGYAYIGTSGRVTITGNIIDVGSDVALLTSPIFITDITTPKVKDVYDFVNADGEFRFRKATAGRTLLWTNGEDLSFSATTGGAPSMTIDKTTGKIKFIDETASTPVKLDSNKGLTSGSFGTGAGTFCEGNDSRILASSQMIVKQTQDTSHTGDTSTTIISNLQIPANSLGANDIGEVEAMFFKTGVAGTATWTVYIGPNSNDLTGASVLFNSVNTAGQGFASGYRAIVNKNSQSTNYSYLPSGGVESPWLNGTAPRTAINQNFANDLYLMVAVALGNSGDIGGVDWIYFKKK